MQTQYSDNTFVTNRRFNAKTGLYTVQYTMYNVPEYQCCGSGSHFGQPDPDPGSKNTAEIMENFHKKEYHTFI